MLAMLPSLVLAERPSERAKRLVQESLLAESRGSEDERLALLRAAQQEDPSEPSLCWRLGHVRQGKEWKPIESVSSEPSANPALAHYRRLRDQSEPTVQNHLKLAAFCEQRNLPNAAIAHRMAVLEMAPDHEYTRRKLGYQFVNGQWLIARDVESQMLKNRRIQEAMQSHADRLRRIARRLENHSMSVEEATEAILQGADIHGIPAWEHYLSTVHTKGALAVVGALQTMQRPEATLSLARHAVLVADPTARLVAMQSLSKRDPYAFVPPLLGELQEPWEMNGTHMAIEGNRIIYRHVATSERQDKRTRKIVDNSYSLFGNVPLASQMANNANAFALMQSEQIRYELNAQIQQSNQRIIDTLRYTTGESLIGTPRDWWKWWDNHTEVYSDEEKPFETSYDARLSFVSGPSLAERSLASWTTGTSTERLRKDCLAPGTLVLTDQGPRAIEHIEVGDSVWSKNLESGEVGLQPVLRTTIREPGYLIRITLTDRNHKDTVIRTSGGHPLFVNGLGWVRARELQPEMPLHGLEGISWVKKTEVEIEKTETYNLVIYETHSYFVGPNAVLSHDNSMVTPATAVVPGLTRGLDDNAR